MTEEEKILERFTRERMRHSKGSFNLPDNDDDVDEQLTHLGKVCSTTFITTQSHGRTCRHLAMLLTSMSPTRMI